MITNEIIKSLSEYATPELCDGMEEKQYRIMDSRIRRQVTKEKIVGTAFTVRVPCQGGGLVPDAIMEAKEGDIIVIDAAGYSNRAVWGDYRSLCAKAKGIAGVVIDGAFRDINECEEIGFPIFAINATPRGGRKEAEGEMNKTIKCGDVYVNPGDLIVADSNGILVISPEDAKGIMAKSDKKRKAEQATIRRMKEIEEIIPRVQMDLL